MTCELWREHLDAYIDGSGSVEEQGQLEEHLRGCPACAAEAIQRLRLKRATKAAAAARFTPPPEFRRRIEKSLQSRRQPAFGSRWIAGFAIAATLLVAAVVSSAWVRHVERQEALAELLDLHIATMASSNPVDVVSTDRHTVKPWFQGKLPFSFNLPDLDNSPFRLIGGKMVYLNHSPGAQLLYLSGKHQVSVFILQYARALSILETQSTSGRENGFSFESRTVDGLHFFVVSDGSTADVHQLVELLSAAQEP